MIYVTGEKIREFRKKHRYSQRQLAELLGVSQTAVSAWENGSRSITLDVVEKISSILGEPVTAFFDTMYAEQIAVDKEGRFVRDAQGDVRVKTAWSRAEPLDWVLEDEMRDYIEKAAREADAMLQKRLERVPDQVLLDGIVEVFRGSGKIGKFELYRFAMMMAEITVPINRYESERRKCMYMNGDDE